MVSRYAMILTILLMLQGCAGFSTVDNRFKQSDGHPAGYSFLQGRNHGARKDDITLILAFSGGGTRAAALSYGVLKALKDTSVTLNGQDDLGAKRPAARPLPLAPDKAIPPLQETIIQSIRDALTACGGKVGGKGGAAELMGLNPSTLRSRMRKLNIAFGIRQDDY